MPGKTKTKASVVAKKQKVVGLRKARKAKTAARRAAAPKSYARAKTASGGATGIRRRAKK